jgi:hypothetical protein
MNIAAEQVRPDHHVELTDEWALWRDFAVRSAGFPVEGLEAFGPGEEARLAAVARDPAFREAVAWQSRESLARAVDKLADGAAGSPSRRRRRVDVTGAYWQRYCSKNDTIGFFGPLAWGSFAEHGDALAVRSGELERERVVHFETWAMEAVAAAAGLATALPMGPYPERALRPLLSTRPGSTAWRLRAMRCAPRPERTSPPRSTGSTACSRRSPGGRPRGPTATAAAGGRSPTSIACATST